MKHSNGRDVVSIIPMAANLDHRLTLIQYRVLIAILSFRNKDTGIATVKRSTLSERCGYQACKISNATTALESLGWLKKTGQGGHSRPCEYLITVPESGTVPKLDTLETVPESGTPTVPESGTPTVPESGTRKEQSIEQSFEQSSVLSAREDDSLSPDARRGALAIFLRQRGVNITPGHPDLCQWVNSGLTDAEAQEAVDRAREYKPDPQPIPARYLSTIVAKVIGERDARTQKCPAAASTAPGALSSSNPNRGPHHARQTKPQQRASINTFLRNVSNPDGIVELTLEQYEHHRRAVSQDGGMLREPVDLPVPGGRGSNGAGADDVERRVIWAH